MGKGAQVATQQQQGKMVRTPRVQSPPMSSPLPPNSATNGKKKKKKGKGKGTGGGGSVDTSSSSNAAHSITHGLDIYDDDCDDEDDSLPPLEPIPPTTGLSPTFESVHFSATASLAVSPHTHNPAAQSELLATASDLHRNMGMMHGPNGEGGITMTTTTTTTTSSAVGVGGMVSAGDEYWAAFPPHIKDFVRSVWAQRPFESPGDERAKTQAMYAIAQQMVQSEKTTTTTTATAGKGGDAVAHPPSLPFDPSMFSDPAFTTSLEQATAAFSAAPLLPSTNVVIEQEEYYCEHEGAGEEIEGDCPPRLTKERIREAFQQPRYIFEKSIKTNKGRAGAEMTGRILPEMAPNLTPSAPAGLIRKRSAPDQSDDISKQMPVAAGLKSQPAAHPAQAPPPPPSSRAAGKQPMAYVPANQNNQQTAAQRTTSARAASKAPLPPHAYPHNHPHHHPSPPSSNASAPHKPRPPAANTAPAPSKPNNKIWSTSSTEERERIKEFWLGLGEEERRNLVKIEKDTVLRKMKEQQKHSCSCAVCGRKRFVTSFYRSGKFFTDFNIGYIFFLLSWAMTP